MRRVVLDGPAVGVDEAADLDEDPALLRRHVAGERQPFVRVKIDSENALCHGLNFSQIFFVFLQRIERILL